LGKVDDSSFLDQVRHFWREILSLYPNAAFTNFGPEHDSLPRVQKRKFWYGVTYFLMAMTCFHNWEYDNLQDEKAKYEKQAVEMLAEIEEYFKHNK